MGNGRNDMDPVGMGENQPREVRQKNILRSGSSWTRPKRISGDIQYGLNSIFLILQRDRTIFISNILQAPQ